MSTIEVRSPARKDAAYGIDQIRDQSSENVIARQGIDGEKGGQIPEKQRSFFAVEQDLCERLLVVYEKSTAYAAIIFEQVRRLTDE